MVLYSSSRPPIFQFLPIPFNPLSWSLFLPVAIPFLPVPIPFQTGFYPPFSPSSHPFSPSFHPLSPSSHLLLSQFPSPFILVPILFSPSSHPFSPSSHPLLSQFPSPFILVPFPFFPSSYPFTPRFPHLELVGGGGGGGFMPNLVCNHTCDSCYAFVQCYYSLDYRLNWTPFFLINCHYLFHLIIIITRCLKTHFTTYGSLNAFYNKLFT